MLTYKFKYIVFSICLSITVSIFSQNKTEPSCGTITNLKVIEHYNKIKPQIKHYETALNSAKFSNDGIPKPVINSVPVKVFVVKNSDGSGGLSSLEIEHAISNLNILYKGAFLEFFVCDGISYIEDDNLNHLKKGAEKSLTNNYYVPGLINMYFTDTIENESNENICGYTENRNDMLFMTHGCATNGSSLAHELGHFFSLLHTHGSGNAGTTTELVDGSNCDTDGDGICDTPADPGLSTATVNNFCNYTGAETDANGDAYTPSTKNIMSYSRKGCRTQFTEQQLARMYAFYMTTKNYLTCPTFNANIAVNESETCQETLTVNFESISDNVTQWQWDVNGDDIIDYTTKNPTHTFNTGIYDVTLTVKNNTETIRKTFKNLIKVGTTIELIDENFEDFNLLDKHGWTSTDVTGHGYQWYANTGETESKTTGPKDYKNVDGKLNTYIYAEASGGELGDSAEFISPCILVKNQNSELEFAYHMFGKNIGELHVDIKTDSGYINDVIDPIYGSQQDNQSDDFKTRTINLSRYTNETIKVRFRAIRGSGWDGDIAIDNILMKTIDTPITNILYEVYPNPINDGLLYVKNYNEDTTSMFTVTNLVGQPILSGIVSHNPIDFRNLASGTYLLTLTNGKSRVVKKIIK